MTVRKESINEIKLFLIYTFSISWIFWLIIIIANQIFDALWYGEILTWVPMIIGSLGPAIGGRMYMVTKRKDWYKNKFISIFGGVKICAIENYYVFMAIKMNSAYAKAKKRGSYNADYRS